MAHGGGAAVDTEPLLWNAQPVAAMEQLDGKGLVQPPMVDVVDREPMAPQQPRRREDRADAHLIGFATRHGQAAEQAKRPQAARFRQAPGGNDRETPANLIAGTDRVMDGGLPSTWALSAPQPGRQLEPGIDIGLGRDQRLRLVGAAHLVEEVRQAE